jgi:Sensors of blue-light using FAD
MNASLSILLYVSAVAPGVGDADIKAILATAHAYNPEHGITGALLCKPRHFLQAIEGPPREVNRLFDRIRADLRHTDVQLLLFGPIEQRCFAGWAMRHTPVPEGHDGVVTDFLRDLSLRLPHQKPELALELLKWLPAAPPSVAEPAED